MDATSYHDRSKHTPEKLSKRDVTLDPSTKPRPTKLYRNLERRSLDGVRPPQIPALSAVAFSRATPVGSGSRVPDPRQASSIDPATEPVSSDRTEYPASQEAWQASTLADGPAAAEWRGQARDADGIGQAATGEGDRIPLDPVDADTQSKRPLAATVRRRGSCREYDDKGPSRRQVATVLDRALRGTPGNWNAGAAEGLGFNDCYLLATGVQGLDDGTYQYHPGRSVLERFGDVTPATKRTLALGQPWAGQAHVNVYLLADVPVRSPASPGRAGCTYRST